MVKVGVMLKVAVMLGLAVALGMMGAQPSPRMQSPICHWPFADWDKACNGRDGAQARGSKRRGSTRSRARSAGLKAPSDQKLNRKNCFKFRSNLPPAGSVTDKSDKNNPGSMAGFRSDFK